jgi:hypothetical protein
MKYTVTLPENFLFGPERAFVGAGRFVAGVPRDVELSEEQADSLKSKGLKVEPFAEDEIPAAPIEDDENEEV